MTLSESIRQIMEINCLRDDKLDYERFLQVVSARHIHGVDGELSRRLQTIATPYAADHIMRHIHAGKHINFTVVSMGENKYKVTHDDHEYSVNMKAEYVSCTCKFYSTMNLPCRYIFGCPDAIDLFGPDWIPARWKINQHQLKTASCPEQEDVIIKVDKMMRKKGMTRNEKYNEMHRLLRTISDDCADQGHKEFCRRYDVFVTLQKAWRDGQDVSVLVGCRPIDNQPDPVPHNNEDGASDTEQVEDHLDPVPLSDEDVISNTEQVQDLSDLVPLGDEDVIYNTQQVQDQSSPVRLSDEDVISTKQVQGQSGPVLLCDDVPSDTEHLQTQGNLDVTSNDEHIPLSHNFSSSSVEEPGCHRNTQHNNVKRKKVLDELRSRLKLQSHHKVRGRPKCGRQRVIHYAVV
ncbi:uncharacterized protein LOC117108549 [Anneissia japonica]|uniref:uncharacterized protein LOC117108549 n=1 Tax=Anneissia japonica TaxID=1529436 RepID=UPI0014258C48|nr:uncharacterized protein LOC117108549 [Anneissia japonica]